MFSHLVLNAIFDPLINVQAPAQLVVDSIQPLVSLKISMKAEEYEGDIESNGDIDCIGANFEAFAATPSESCAGSPPLPIRWLFPHKETILFDLTINSVF